MRRGLVRNRVGHDEVFRWRGEEVSRIEGFSDAVFAFAVTLLVVSLEVPSTFDELLATMRGFFAFAVCFVILLSIWYDHYKFSRRYGLDDPGTTFLTGTLLFIVLFYIYPLKFLFTWLADVFLGFPTTVRLPNGATVDVIEPDQLPLLMAIYGIGFVAVHLVFMLLHLRAYRLRGELGLDARELSATRKEMRGFSLNALIGLASIAIALLGGPGWVSWSGMAYFLIFPAQIANGRLTGPVEDRKPGG